ncbi:LPP20 family lipoprotein [Sulfurimonas sp.]
MRIFISLFLTLIVLSGCGSQKRIVVEKRELPVWYANPIKSTSTTLYAVGEGQNKQEAVTNALNNMASTLSVSLSSEFNTKSVVKDGTITSHQITSVNEINTKVNTIRITNYEIVNSKDFSFKRYLAEVKSDKRKLFSGLKKEIDQKLKMIQNKNSEVQNYNAIKRLVTYKDVNESTSDIKTTLLVMSSLNPSFNDAGYISKIQEIQNRYDRLLSKISFSIDSNSDAKNLKSSIANGLSAKKYSIKNGSGKNHFNIYLSSNTSKANSYGFDLARSAISITVKDNNGVIIGSNKLNITGQSTQGYTIAKENVAIKLNDMIKKDGIAKVIGLEI